MAELRERKPEEKKQSSVNVLVKTCIDPVAVKTYEDLKGLLEEHYPNAKFNFQHELYPVPMWKDIVGRACNAVFALFCLVLIIILIIPKTPYSYLISDEFMTLFRSKKWALVIVVGILNYISENIQKTGAFEVYLNDKLITSKLEEGDYPDEETLFKCIDKELYNCFIKHTF